LACRHASRCCSFCSGPKSRTPSALPYRVSTPVPSLPMEGSLREGFVDAGG
jgi:hypothetical protein